MVHIDKDQCVSSLSLGAYSKTHCIDSTLTTPSQFKSYFETRTPWMLRNDDAFLQNNPSMDSLGYCGICDRYFPDNETLNEVPCAYHLKVLVLLLTSNHICCRLKHERCDADHLYETGQMSSGSRYDGYDTVLEHRETLISVHLNFTHHYEQTSFWSTVSPRVCGGCQRTFGDAFALESVGRFQSGFYVISYNVQTKICSEISTETLGTAKVTAKMFIRT